MKKRIFLPITLSFLILVCGTIVVCLMYNHWTNNPIKIKNTVVTKITEQKNEKSLKSIIHESQKNVVQIEAVTDWSEKIGSGFLYNNKGDIITNAHVVKNATSIYVKTANAQTYTAAVVGIGEKKDIAVIRVPQLANKSPALLDKSYQAELGNEIIAVGSPLGFQHSVTLGIISGLNRSFTIDGYEYQDVYQISANITHGNSGGPLIDRNTGKVIAVNSAGTEEGNLGFSIPINSILEDVTKWSAEANAEDLVYNNLVKNSQVEDQEQLKTDAEYIINYFFESLAIRDYINAYTLLGSKWQTKTTYKAFREDYIHVQKIETMNVTSRFLENKNIVKINLQVEMVVRDINKATKKEVYDYTFFIGLENDLLKILDGERVLTSTVKITTDTN